MSFFSVLIYNHLCIKINIRFCVLQFFLYIDLKKVDTLDTNRRNVVYIDIRGVSKGGYTFCCIQLGGYTEM